MTKIYKIIKIEDYGILVDDKNTCKTGELLIDTIDNNFIYAAKVDSGLVKGLKVVIGSIGKRLDGVPLIELAKIGDAKDFLIKEYKHAKDVNNFGESAQLLSYNQVCRLMEDYAGYKANTNKYSEEDMRNIFLASKEFANDTDAYTILRDAKPKYSFNSYMQSLQKQPIPTEVELDVEYLNDDDEWSNEPKYPHAFSYKERVKIHNKETNTITPINIFYE